MTPAREDVEAVLPAESKSPNSNTGQGESEESTDSGSKSDSGSDNDNESWAAVEAEMDKMRAMPHSTGQAEGNDPANLKAGADSTEGVADEQQDRAYSWNGRGTAAHWGALYKKGDSNPARKAGADSAHSITKGVPESKNEPVAEDFSLLTGTFPIR